MTRDDVLRLLKPLSDEAILGLTLYGEARGEPIEGIIAVGCVIRNRVRKDLKGDTRPDWWGETYRGVCLAKWQFSCWTPKGGEDNFHTVIQAAKGLLAKTPATPLLEQCAWVALGISRGAILDTVKGADHYHTVQMQPRPAWAQQFVPITQVRRHLFYRLYRESAA
jgi:hypothetical protein